MRLLVPLLAVLLLTSPFALAGGGDPTISTGEVDMHGDPPGTICIPVDSAWTIRLTLLATAPGDTVSLTALFEEPPVAATVATHLTPQVDVQGETGSTCKPTSYVTGILVNGAVPYTIQYMRGFAS